MVPEHSGQYCSYYASVQHISKLLHLVAMRISVFVCVSLSLSLLAVLAGVTMVITFGHVIVIRNTRSDDFRQTICHVTALRQIQYDINELHNNFVSGEQYEKSNEVFQQKINDHQNQTNDTDAGAMLNWCISVEVRYTLRLVYGINKGSTMNTSAILYSDLIDYINRDALQQVGLTDDNLMIY